MKSLEAVRGEGSGVRGKTSLRAAFDFTPNPSPLTPHFPKGCTCCSP
jgi:hypothetical protein